MPQNIDYSVTGIHRERVNGQLTLQWQPVKAFTGTLDYTYSQNRLDSKRNDISSWFNFGPSSSSWTNGPAATPLVYTETLTNADVAMGVAKFGVETTLRSLGVNLNWKATDSLQVRARRALVQLDLRLRQPVRHQQRASAARRSTAATPRSTSRTTSRS